MCLTKIQSEKKIPQSSPTKSATKNGSLQISHQLEHINSFGPKNWEALQLLDLPSSLEPNIILMNSVSWRKPQCWEEVSVVGLKLWFDWLKLWFDWLELWLSPPTGLVQVVWLWWSCNLQGLFGPAKDGQGMEMDDRTWVKGIFGGVKKAAWPCFVGFTRKIKM